MAFEQIKVKICGMQDLQLCKLALHRGASYIGMIHHQASPRHIELEPMSTLCQALPEGTRVGVIVAPDIAMMHQMWATGIDILQVHLKQFDDAYLQKLRENCPPGKLLWLSPKWKPGTDFPDAVLSYADAVVVDTYSEKVEGGTGETGDWRGYRRLCARYPETEFILSGGLNAGNIGDALKQTNTRFIDLSSGVETSPGIKTESSINDFFDALTCSERA